MGRPDGVTPPTPAAAPSGGGVGGLLRRLVAVGDGFQRRHHGVGFGYAVVKKYGQDQAGNQAALLTYYAFFSLFPLLLVLVTVLGLVLHSDPRLQQSVLRSALASFPVIGGQLRHNVGHLSSSGVGLVVGILGTFLGARGVANAAQNASNTVWGVPFTDRPGFPKNLLRSLGWIVVVGIGEIVTTSAATVVGGLHVGSAALGPGLQLATVVVTALLNVAVFVGGFRLATSPVIATRDLIRGAVIAAIAWTVLQRVGGYVVNHELKHASAVYGTFGLVIGLLSWLYLLAQFTLYAMEIDVVRVQRLYPRSLADPLTPADRRADESYARQQPRHRGEAVAVDFTSTPADTPTPAGETPRRGPLR